MKPYRVLSIDGGGARGIIPAHWLSRLESARSERLKEAPHGQAVGECFDLIAGVSTGAIIACALAKGTTAANLAVMYESQLQVVFPSAADRLWSRAGRFLSDGPSAPKYDGLGLELALENIFGDWRFGNLFKPTVVLTYDAYNRRPWMLCSWDTNLRDVKVRDILRASCAAPTYFPGHMLPVNGVAVPCVDGGVASNNPSLLALAALSVLESRYNVPVDYQDVRLLSLGTGRTTRHIDGPQIREWGALEWAMPLYDVLLDGSSESAHLIAREMMGGNYVRMQCLLSRGYDDLDDVSRTNLNALVTVAEGYLTDNGGLAAFEKALSWMTEGRP